MEKNIKVRTIIAPSYFDVVEQEYKLFNSIMYLDEKRARDLDRKKFIKLIEIRKCVNEPNRKNATRNTRKQNR